MNPNPRKPSRRRAANLAPEMLETRSLLTGGAGNTFAVMSQTIVDQGGSVAVPFTIAPDRFTSPKGKLVVGIDVVAQKSNNVEPVVVSVADAAGRNLRPVSRAIYTQKARRTRANDGPATTAVLVDLPALRPGATAPAAYTAKVAANNNTNGNFLIGFYLPGDADGNGKVDKADTALTRSLNGAKADSARYNYEADANRDGKINRSDLQVVRRNQGASTTISPTVTAVLDPASDVGAPDRVTNLSVVRFTGAASPGATLTFAEVANKVAPTIVVAGADGTYTADVPLANGSNTFRVTSVDAFGQAISGSLSPVVFNVNPTPIISGVSTATA